MDEWFRDINAECKRVGFLVYVCSINTRESSRQKAERQNEREKIRIWRTSKQAFSLAS